MDHTANVGNDKSPLPAAVSDAETDNVEDISEAETVILDTKRKRQPKIDMSDDDEEDDENDDDYNTAIVLARKRVKRVSPGTSSSGTSSTPGGNGSGTGPGAGASANTMSAIATNGKKKYRRDASGRMPLQKLCDRGDFEGARQLILAGADVNDRDYAGNTALHDAALKGHTTIVELLLDNGADVDIRSGVSDLDTPLIDAASHGHVDIVKLLLNRGADPRICNAQGKTALDFVSSDDPNAGVVSSLLKEAVLDFRHRNRHRSVSESSSIPPSNTNMISTANISNGGNNSNEASSFTNGGRRRGARAQSIRNDLLWMDLTTKTGREQVAKKAAEGDIQFVGRSLEEGWQPDPDCLVSAAKHGHFEVVNLLLAFGVGCDDLNSNGVTALHETVGRGHIDTIKLLLDQGADPCWTDASGRSYVDVGKEYLPSDDEEIIMLQAAMDKKKTKRNPSELTKHPAKKMKVEDKERANDKKRYNVQLQEEGVKKKSNGSEPLEEKGESEQASVGHETFGEPKVEERGGSLRHFSEALSAEASLDSSVRETSVNPRNFNGPSKNQAEETTEQPTRLKKASVSPADKLSDHPEKRVENVDQPGQPTEKLKNHLERMTEKSAAHPARMAETSAKHAGGLSADKSIVELASHVEHVHDSAETSDNQNKKPDLTNQADKIIEKPTAESVTEKTDMATIEEKSLIDRKKSLKVLDLQREKERKQREHDMLKNLELQEKFKEERRKRSENVPSSIIVGSTGTATASSGSSPTSTPTLSNAPPIFSRRQSMPRKNLPYGLRMQVLTETPASRSVDDILPYLPILIRCASTGAQYILDVQLCLVLGVSNVFQRHPELSRKLVSAQEKERLWTLVTPWLSKPMSLFSNEKMPVNEILADRADDRAKFLSMSLFWIKADQVWDMLKIETPHLYNVCQSNVSQIDLEYQEPATEIRTQAQILQHSLPPRIRAKLLGYDTLAKW